MNARTAIVRSLAVLPFLLLSVVLAPKSPAGAPLETVSILTGVVTGRLVSSVDGSPFAHANLIVLGTRRGAVAAGDGIFRITEVPTGDHDLRIMRPGFRPLTIPIRVRLGENRLGDVSIELPTPPAPVEIGVHAEVRPSELEIRIRPTHSRIVVGDKPAFDVRIINHGTRPVFLVQSVDASDAGASPRVKLEITGPEGGYVVSPVMRCGNRNGVRLSDFVEVGPEGEFDPYAGGWLGSNLMHGSFAKAGLYTATFRYATSDTNARAWAEGPCIDCALYSTLRDLLAQVPAVDLVDSVKFRVDRR
jgi:hypothetical protein